jgi:hypothetical protein
MSSPVPQDGSVGPAQPRALAGLEFQKALAANDPQYLSTYLQSMQMENDPLRKIQLEDASLGLQSKRQEIDRGKNLAALFSNPMVDPDGPEGPEAPRKLSALEVLQKATAYDPRFADTYLKAELEASKPQIPEGAKLPEGFMWGQDANGKPVAVPIPGMQASDAAGPFKGNSVEAQAYNMLVAAGVDPIEAAKQAVTKVVSGPNGEMQAYQPFTIPGQGTPQQGTQGPLTTIREAQLPAAEQSKIRDQLASI